MNRKQLFKRTLPLVIGVAALLLVGSCASFGLVSQRPAAGASVDATTAATGSEVSSDATKTEYPKKKADTAPDAVAAATE